MSAGRGDPILFHDIRRREWRMYDASMCRVRDESVGASFRTAVLDQLRRPYRQQTEHHKNRLGKFHPPAHHPTVGEVRTEVCTPHATSASAASGLGNSADMETFCAYLGRLTILFAIFLALYRFFSSMARMSLASNVRCWSFDLLQKTFTYVVLA